MITHEPGVEQVWSNKAMPIKLHLYLSDIRGIYVISMGECYGGMCMARRSISKNYLCCLVSTNVFNFFELSYSFYGSNIGNKYFNV